MRTSLYCYITSSLGLPLSLAAFLGLFCPCCCECFFREGLPRLHCPPLCLLLTIYLLLAIDLLLNMDECWWWLRYILVISLERLEHLGAAVARGSSSMEMGIVLSSLRCTRGCWG